MPSRLQGFPPLPEWHMAAVRAARARGYPGPSQLPYAWVDVPDPAAPIDLPAFGMARLRIRRPVLTNRAPRGLSAFLQALIDRNPSVSVIQVDLVAYDRKALEQVAWATAKPEPNATVRLHMGKAPGGEPLFHQQAHHQEAGQGSPQPPPAQKHTHRYLKSHVPSTLPNYSLSRVTNNIRRYNHRQQRDQTHADQADHEATKTTAHRPQRSCSRHLTVNRPHASRPTPNQLGVHGSKRERRPSGWRHRGAPRPPTTMSANKTMTQPPRNRPTNVTRLHGTVKRPTNQPRRPTSNPRPPERAQPRPSQEA